MPFDMITEILDDVSKWEQPLTEIIPVNYGEFFLRADWPLILNQIAHKLPNTQIVIPTNGLLLDDKAIDTVCKVPSVRIINFSVNAYFAETYKEFTKLDPANLDNIRKAVARFRLLRPDITLWASMVFSPSSHTDLERDLFIKHWIQWAHPQILTASSAGRKGGALPLNPVKIPCRSIFSDIVVGFDGLLSSCCFDAGFRLELSKYSGDLKADWRNKELENLRLLHNKGMRDEITLCQACSFA